MLEKFHLEDAKIISTPLGSYFNLIKKSPQIDEDNKGMAKVSYASAIVSNMYAMTCTR